MAQARTERALACVFQRACLAADGLTWPSTHRRCDFRDCQSMIYSLVDMMNLARTRLILGSGYSSYSEVAAQMGGRHGAALPILMAGRDFGTIVERRGARTTRLSSFNEFDSVDLTGFRQRAAEEDMADFLPRYWPCPF